MIFKLLKNYIEYNYKLKKIVFDALVKDLII